MTSRLEEVDGTARGWRFEWNEVELFSVSQIISQKHVVTLYGSQSSVTRVRRPRMTVVEAIACSSMCVGYNDGDALRESAKTRKLRDMLK